MLNVILSYSAQWKIIIAPIQDIFSNPEQFCKFQFNFENTKTPEPVNSNEDNEINVLAKKQKRFGSFLSIQKF